MMMFFGYGMAVGKTDQKIPFAVEYQIVLTTDWSGTAQFYFEVVVDDYGLVVYFPELFKRV